MNYNDLRIKFVPYHLTGLKGLGLKFGVEKSGVEMSFNLWSPVGYWRCCTSNSMISKLFHSRLHQAEKAKKSLNQLIWKILARNLHFDMYVYLHCDTFILMHHNLSYWYLCTLFLKPFFLSFVRGHVPSVGIKKNIPFSSLLSHRNEIRRWGIPLLFLIKYTLYYIYTACFLWGQYP